AATPTTAPVAIAAPVTAVTAVTPIAHATAIVPISMPAATQPAPHGIPTPLPTAAAPLPPRPTPIQPPAAPTAPTLDTRRLAPARPGPPDRRPARLGLLRDHRHPLRDRRRRKNRAPRARIDRVGRGALTHRTKPLRHGGPRHEPGLDERGIDRRIHYRRGTL